MNKIKGPRRFIFRGLILWRLLFMAGILSLEFVFAGCVRLGGSAGYWKTGTDGETKSQQVDFDTARFFPSDPTQGSITT